MKKYYCESNAYNQLVFVDDTNNAIGFDASTKEEAENMDISGIIDLKTTEEIAHHCSRETMFSILTRTHGNMLKNSPFIGTQL